MRDLFGRYLLAVVAVAVVGNSGCQANFPAAPDPVVAALHLHYGRPLTFLQPRGQLPLTAYAINTDGVYEDVSAATLWTSSDTAVVTVTGGRFPTVTAVGGGDATIRASYRGFSDVASITVRAITFFSINDVPFLHVDLLASSPFGVGHTAFLHAASGGRSLNDAVTFVSSNPDIARVEGSQLRAIAPGTFTVSATYNGMTAQVIYSVVPRRSPFP